MAVGGVGERLHLHCEGEGEVSMWNLLVGV